MPERRDLVAAERWIAGDAVRRQGWRSLDLVVERAGSVVGEVGLWAFDRGEGSAEIGWWTAEASRGAGVASTAVRALVGWALRDLGLRSVAARCAAGNTASAAVARRAGLAVVDRGADGGLLLVARP